MCGRCDSCNTILNDEEMSTRWPGTSEFINMCFSCIAKSNDDWEPDDQQQLSLFEDEYEQLV